MKIRLFLQLLSICLKIKYHLMRKKNQNLNQQGQRKRWRN